MRIGLAYNEKPDANSASDDYAEWDDPSTIDAVEEALSLFGNVVRLEADEFLPQKLSLAHPEIVFNMAEGLHGPCRESHVPALCEYLNIPYTGSDPLTLALTLHKGRTKEILAYRGVPTAPFRVIDSTADLERLPLPYPLFVKPVAEGSGKGIFVNNLCGTPAQLAERVPFLLDRYSQPVIVETYLPGPEFTVAILGNDGDVRCLPIVGFDFATLPHGAPRCTATKPNGSGTRPSIRSRSSNARRPASPNRSAGRRSASRSMRIAPSGAATGAASTFAWIASACPMSSSSTHCPASSPIPR